MLIPIAGTARLSTKTSSYHRSDVMIIAVHSGFSPPDMIPTEWRFATAVEGIRAGYYELWKTEDEKRRRFQIERSYLHLYGRRRDHLDESEIFALHCDPTEPEDSGLLKQAIYKRGPHVHVKTAEQPLPHSHIALNLAHLDEVLSSFGSLEAAVKSGVALVRDQVLDILDVHMHGLAAVR